MLTQTPILDHEKLRSERKRRNLSTEFVAASIGVSNSSIIVWETGTRNPSAASLAALCKFYGISIDGLFE